MKMLMPTTKAGYANLFNDLGKIYNGVDLGLDESNIQLSRDRVGFETRIPGGFASMKLDFDRWKFDRSMRRLVDRMQDVVKNGSLFEEPTA